MDNRQEDDILKNKFSDFEITPAASSFDAFGAKLAAAQRKKKRRAIIFYLSGSGLAAILFLLLLLPPPVRVSRQQVNAMHPVHIPKTKTTLATAEKKAITNKPEIARSEHTHTKVSDNMAPLSPKNPLLPDQQQTSGTAPSVQSQAPAENTITYAPSIHPAQETGITVPGNPTLSDETVFSEIIPVYSLSSLSFSVLPVEESELVTRHSDESIAGKELLNLKAQRFKPAYYAGAGILFLQHHYLNTINNSEYNTGYKDFGQFYVRNFDSTQKKSIAVIPDLYVGAVYKNKWDVSVSFGYYTLSSNEKVIFPTIDSTAIPNTLPGNINPFSQPGQAPVVITKSSTNEPITKENRFSYFYTGLHLSVRLKLGTITIKPGCGIQMNFVRNSSYVLLDPQGYNYQTNGRQLLNPHPVYFNFKLGICKNVFRGAEFQLSPVYVASAQSVFDNSYFVSRKLRGVGLESSFIYKFGK